jgi:transglutaminase-like putative cysteine protease
MLRALLAAALLLPPSSGFAEVLKLRSGADQTAAVVALDAESILLDDGRKIPRADVREIQFAEKKTDAPAAAVDPAAAARGRELFRRADAFGKKYPGVDGLQLVDEGEFVVRPDGTWVERDRFAGIILKDGIKQWWGELGRSFEEGRERVKILKATVYHRDGSVFPFDASKVKVSAPQADALFFQDSRTLTYSLPEVEIGSIIETETETETYNPFRKDFFFPRWGFQGGSPSLESRFAVTVPAGQSLYYASRNFDGAWKARAEPKKTLGADGATTYEWRLDDIPPIVSEPDMVPYFDYAPSVKAALFSDWGRIYDWLAEMYATRTKPSPELAAFTASLVKDAANDDEKVASIYHYVQREVRYISVKMGMASGWGGYDADLTWKRRYGCCIDKAILFSAMLKAVGIDAAPVLLDPNDEARHDYRVPDIGFAHAITYLTVAGRGFFLDSTGYDYRYPELASFDHGSTAVDVFKRVVRDIPVPDPDRNRNDYVYDIKLDASGGADVSYAASYNGVNEGEVRGYYKTLKDSDLRKSFQDWINETSPSASLVGYKLENLDDISKPFTVSMTYRLGDYLIRAKDLYILKLPDFDREFSEVALDKRRYALQYPTSTQQRHHYVVELPAGFTAASLPARRKLSGPRESFELDCGAKNGYLTCDATMSRAARTYSPADYPAHKAFLEKVSKLTQDRIFLKAGSAR